MNVLDREVETEDFINYVLHLKKKNVKNYGKYNFERQKLHTILAKQLGFKDRVDMCDKCTNVSLDKDYDWELERLVNEQLLEMI